MKEFNLEDCIAGKPVVTRDGRAYKFGAYNPDAIESTKIVGWINGSVYMHCENGKYFINNVHDDHDLFMAPETVEGWVNVYENDFRKYQTGDSIHKNKQDARESIITTRKYIATVRIQFPV